MSQGDPTAQPIANRAPGDADRRSRPAPPTFVCVVLVIAAVFLAYGNALGDGFAYDDHDLLTGNQYLIGWMAGAPDLEGRPVPYVTRLLTSDFASLANRFQDPGGQIPLNYYRPVIAVSYMIDTAFFMEAPRWGVDAPKERSALAWKTMNPSGFHLTNILFHALNAVLCFYLVRALFGVRLVALIAALIFGVHPMGTESVTWIAGRTDVIATTCWLAAFWGYVRFRRTDSPRALGVAFALFTIGTFAKEMVATLPLVLALYEVIRSTLSKGREDAAATGFRRFAPPAALAGCVIPYFIAKAVIATKAVTANAELWAGVSVGTIAQTVPSAFAWYLKKLVFPVSHNAYPMLAFARGIGDWLPSAVLHLAVIAFGVWAIRRSLGSSVAGAGGRRWWGGVGFAVLGLYVTLLPLNCVVPGFRLARYPIDIEFPVAERFLYVPLIFLAIAVGIGLHALARRTHPFVAIALAAALTALGVFGSAARNGDWRDNFALFEATVKASPNSIRMRLNYGAALVYDHHEVREGLRHLDYGVRYTEEVKRERPLHNFFANTAYGNLMRGAFMRSALDEARQLEYGPRTPGLANNVAVMLATFAPVTGDPKLYELAVQHFAIVQQLSGESPAAAQAMQFIGRAGATDARFRGTERPSDDLTAAFITGFDQAAFGIEEVPKPHRAFHAMIVHDAGRTCLPSRVALARLPKASAVLRRTTPRLQALVDRCADHYGTALRDWPGAAALHYVLGEVDRVRGRWLTPDAKAAAALKTKAVARFRRALEIEPDLVGAAARLAEMLLDDGAPKAALRPVRAAVDLLLDGSRRWEDRPLPTDPALVVDLIERVVRGRTLAEAWEAFRRETWRRVLDDFTARTRQPGAESAWKPWNELGVMTARAGETLGDRAKLEEAVGHLRKAIALDSRAEAPLANLIAVLPAVGRHGEAKQLRVELEARRRARRR